MTCQYILAFSVLLFSFCKKSAAPTITTPPIQPPQQDTLIYQLVWSDEFNGASINADTWNFETGGHGWGNNEQEYYQAANAVIENGNLVITAKKETVDSNKYTSSRMNTKGKKEFKYGKIEARIKMTIGQGFWPAFWMLGANIDAIDWPKSGEIDIMERINTDSLVYGTIHWDSAGHAYTGGNTATTPSGYHVYNIEWDNASIKWFVDSALYYQSSLLNSTKTEFQEPFFILFNFALGGNWPGQIIDDSLLPAKMYVDYVRVYQKK